MEEKTKASSDDTITNNDNGEDFSSPAWAQSLSNLSTPLLASKLTALKNQSATLASTLTAKLASSPSGQSLLHIGPSLSTLPPDLQSLLANLEPMLKEIEEYEKYNQNELLRIVTTGKLIEAECRRAANSKECNDLLSDLVAAEQILSSSFVGDKKNNDNDRDSNDHGLNFMVSLERIAYTTLHLVHQLRKSSEQVTSTLASSNNKANKINNRSSLPSMDMPLPQDTEKAQFIMKLAPRIRKLEKLAIQTISKEFERVLNERVKRNKDSITKPSRNENNIIHDNEDYEEEKNNNAQELLILGYLFRSFALLGKGTEAESIFARVAIMPIVRSKVTLGKLDEGGSRGECAGLFCLLQELVFCIRDTWGDVLSMVESMFQVNSDFDLAFCDDDENSIEIDLVTSGVWIPIATGFMTDPSIQMAIFSPGIASILQANYTAMDTFLSELATNLLTPSKPTQESKNEESKINVNFNDMHVEEMLFQSLYPKHEIQLDQIRSVQSRLYKHSMTSDFAKKWNLPIYYQLRFGEACTRLDNAIDRIEKEGWYADVFSGTSDTSKSFKENYGFDIPFFMEFYDIMNWLWRDDVFLRPLTHRFLRGSIQLIGRVLSFLDDGLKGVKFGALQLNVNENGSVGEAIGSPVQGSSYFWKDRIDDVAAVSWDMTILETCIKHDYVSKVAESVSSTQSSSSDSDEIKSLIEGALLETAEGIFPFINKCWDDVIVNILINECSEPLAAVKGVAATYRMTNRPPPTQASPYVATILRPLKEFESRFSSRIPPQVGSEWKRNIVISVTEQYCTAVSELTETVQRTEEALKNRKARRTAAGGMSDGEKVKLQLLLDQREFSKSVTEMGVSIDLVETLVNLTKSAEVLLPK